MNNAALTAICDTAARAHDQVSGYAFTLTFTREFTAGLLVGLTHADTIGFCRAADGDEWVASVNRANAAGKVNYRVIKWSVR
jgi:hypothetical protein